MTKIAGNLKHIRQMNELTQLQFGEIFHVSDSLVSKWEKDKKTPGTDMLIKISKYFGYSLDELLGDSINKSIIRSKLELQLEIRDFKKDFKKKYILFKLILSLILIIVIFFIKDGNEVLTVSAFIIFSIIIGIDLVSLFYNNKRVKKYSADSNAVILMATTVNDKKVIKEYSYNLGKLIFTFISIIIILPLFYIAIDPEGVDSLLKTIAIVIFSGIVFTFILIVVDNLIHPFKKVKIDYYNFKYRYRLFIKKILVVLFELIFFLVYLILFLNGTNQIIVDFKWILLLFPPLLTFLAYDIYISDLKSMSTYDLHIE